MKKINEKICLVTGGSSGLGYITARELARKGARVGIVGRNPQKIHKAAQRISRETGNDRIDVFLTDLSSQKEVRSLAGQLQREYASLDVLINNAGSIFPARQESKDGIEMTLALNHLSGFLLTNLLLDLLNESGSARIINVSSFAHQLVRLNLKDVQNKKGYVGWIVYARSKLANLYFTYCLAEKIHGGSIVCNALHPGYVATGFGTHSAGFWGWFFRRIEVFAVPPEQGALTAIFLASSEAVEGSTAGYYADCKRIASSKASYDRATAIRLWNISLELTQI